MLTVYERMFAAPEMSTEIDAADVERQGGRGGSDEVTNADDCCRCSEEKHGLQLQERIRNARRSSKTVNMQYAKKVYHGCGTDEASVGVAQCVGGGEQQDVLAPE